MHPDLMKAIEKAILRIPLSMSYNLVLFACMCVAWFGCFLVIVRNDVIPIIGDILSVITGSVDDIIDVINYLIGKIEDACYCTIHKISEDDLTALTGADVLKDLPDFCIIYENVFDIIAGLIDLSSASILCPIERYIEPLKWLSDLFVDTYTTSCHLSSTAELCIYCSLGYLVYAIGIFMICCIIIYATREIWAYFFARCYQLYHMIKVSALF